MEIAFQWDTMSMVFYLFLAFIGAACFYIVKKREASTGIVAKIYSKEYILWGLLWTITATFRYVSPTNNVGGTDAYDYALAYEEVFNQGIRAAERLNHYGKAWQMICKALNYICGDYHFFFFVFYLIVAFSFIYFLNEFGFEKMSAAPVITVFFLYLTGYCAMRTILAVAMFLLAITFLWKKKYIPCFIFCILSIAFQTSSALYVMFVPFYILFKNKDIRLIKAFLLALGFTIIGYVARYLLVNGIVSISYYANYARISLTSPFFEDYWKIVFNQLLLIAAILILRKMIFKNIDLLDDYDKKRFDIIWKMCVFDLCTLPITYYIHLWRGIDYLYLARVILWGYIIYILVKRFAPSSKKIFILVSWILCGAWLVFCVWNRWEQGGYMPYVFSLFGSI